MQSINMRARFMLREGCPLMWQDILVTFVRNVVTRLGPLNMLGRPLGLYDDSDRVVVKTKEGVEAAVDCDMCRLVPESRNFVTQVFEKTDRERRYLGPLECPPAFYPDDDVQDMRFPWRRLRVISVSYERDDGMPEYAGFDSDNRYVTSSGKEYELISAGSVRLLYTDPSKLVFRSAEEELQFWARDWIGDISLGRAMGGQTLWACADAFRKGYADFIMPAQRKPFFSTYKLCPAFAEHRERVRAVTERLYGALMTEEIERVARTRQDTTD